MLILGLLTSLHLAIYVVENITKDQIEFFHKPLIVFIFAICSLFMIAFGVNFLLNKEIPKQEYKLVNKKLYEKI